VEVKDLIQHDCFAIYGRDFKALAWLWDVEAGPMLCARHYTGIMVLIDPVIHHNKTLKAMTYDSYHNDLNWQKRVLGQHDRAVVMHIRRGVRVEREQFCPEFKTSQSLRELLLSYKTGMMQRVKQQCDSDHLHYYYVGCSTYAEATRVWRGYLSASRLPPFDKPNPANDCTSKPLSAGGTKPPLWTPPEGTPIP